MSLSIKEIVDYQSASTGSSGGIISSTVMPECVLTVQALIGDQTVQVDDTSLFLVGQEVILFDGTNFDDQVIASIDSMGSTLTFNDTLNYNFDVNTSISMLSCLFPDFTQDQASVPTTIYRKFYRKNTNSSNDLVGSLTFIPYQPDEGCFSIGFGLNDSHDTDATQGNMVALSVADKIKVVSDGADTRTLTIFGLVSGVFTSETVTLNGTTPVVSTNTFDAGQVFAVQASAISASRTATIKENTSGNTIGTIGINKITCWLWFGQRIVNRVKVAAEGGDIPGAIMNSQVNSTNALYLGDLGHGSSFPFWVRYMNISAQAYEMTILDLKTLGSA